jgi:urease subunit alpha
VRRDTITELRSSGSSRRLADVVLWRPAWFGAKPETVRKGGWFAWGACGEGNVSVRQAQPVRFGAHLGGEGAAAAASGVTFVSRRAEEADAVRALGLGRRTSVVRDLRDLGRDRLHANRTTLPVEVAAGGTVHARGRVLAAGPGRSLPLNRRFRLS